MIKSLALLSKRADVSVEYFHWHWREVHGPLALRIEALRRYVQNHRLRDSVGGFPRLPQEGIAEVWLDDAAAAAALATNPQFVEHAGPDELNFMDREASRSMKCEEEVLLAGPAIAAGDPGIKTMLFLARDERGPDRLDRCLTDDLGELCGALPRLRRLTVSRPLSGLPETSPYAALVELSWPGIAAYDRGWAGPAGTALRRAVAESVDLDASAAVLVEEYRLIW